MPSMGLRWIVISWSLSRTHLRATKKTNDLSEQSAGRLRNKKSFWTHIWWTEVVMKKSIKNQYNTSTLDKDHLLAMNISTDTSLWPNIDDKYWSWADFQSCDAIESSRAVDAKSSINTERMAPWISSVQSRLSSLSCKGNRTANSTHDVIKNGNWKRLIYEFITNKNDELTDLWKGNGRLKERGSGRTRFYSQGAINDRGIEPSTTFCLTKKKLEWEYEHKTYIWMR